jgi:hypothetical protein
LLVAGGKAECQCAGGSDGQGFAEWSGLHTHMRGSIEVVDEMTRSLKFGSRLDKGGLNRIAARSGPVLNYCLKTITYVIFQDQSGM